LFGDSFAAISEANSLPIEVSCWNIKLSVSFLGAILMAKEEVKGNREVEGVWKVLCDLCSSFPVVGIRRGVEVTFFVRFFSQ